MRLAIACAYPHDYFLNMADDNDEELEIERNDVRDILRALAGTGEDRYTRPPFFSVCVLDRILCSCSEVVTDCAKAGQLPAEAVVHSFSALAKPLNHLAEAHEIDEVPSALAREIVRRAVHTMGILSMQVVAAFAKVPDSNIFAVSRLLDIAVASFTPLFASICRKSTLSGVCEPDKCLRVELIQMLTRAMHASALSVAQIPELAAESTLDHTQYDIIGAMRGPGGEDHVGVLVFMRLVDESEELASHISQVQIHEESSLLVDLCRLHDQLKTFENERQPGVSYGKGVTPKSRRILLSTIAKLAQFTDHSIAESERSQAMLYNFFCSVVSTIASKRSSLSSPSAQLMFQLCEATFDLASFGPAIISSFLDGDESTQITDFVQTLVESGTFGYTVASMNEAPNDLLVQVRTLFFSLPTHCHRSNFCFIVVGAIASCTVHAGRCLGGLRLFVSCETCSDTIDSS
jgi:hypothetical protein